MLRLGLLEWISQEKVSAYCGSSLQQGGKGLSGDTHSSECIGVCVESVVWCVVCGVSGGWSVLYVSGVSV